MINTTTVEFPLGYTIASISETIDVADTSYYLSSKKQRKYSSAIRSNQLVELKRHVWICPYCGERIPAYLEYFHMPSIFRSVPKAELENWASLQQSFFDMPHAPLYLNEPISKGNWRCPKCDRESSPSSKTKTVVYTQNKHTLSISIEIDNIGELLSMRWLKGHITRIAFPMFETVVFNFRKGTTYLKLHSENGTIISITDITHQPDIWHSGALHEALTCSKINVRTMRHIFKKCYQHTFPFEDKELNTEKYVLLTRFIGYSRNFYDAIPFIAGTWKIDSSFNRVAKQLHRASIVPLAYEKAGLPKAKSIRRLFYENPGMMFYVDACVRLWQLVGDVNLFRKLLTSRAIFAILSQIHIFPGVWDFYQDFIVTKGPRSLIDRLERDYTKTNFDAVTYAAMNTPSKKAEQKKWKTSKSSMFSLPHEDDEDDERRAIVSLPQPITYSIPMHSVCNVIKPCSIDGFYFTWLHNLNEYTNAGRKLKNCLKYWKQWQYPVVIVYFREEIVAAIEVNTDKLQIIQAHTARNGYISEDSALGQAYEKWRKRYGLEFFRYF